MGTVMGRKFKRLKGEAERAINAAKCLNTPQAEKPEESSLA
jgi:hypothetical protein